MPAEWALCIVAPIFMGKGNIRNCSCHRAIKHPEHGMNVVERVLEKRSLRLKWGYTEDLCYHLSFLQL